MMYLVIKCSELGDQWECDADREPVCLTEDVSSYGLGYEIYQVNPDNTFTIIKDYDTPLNFGVALSQWEDPEDREEEPSILQKWHGLYGKDATRTLVRKAKNKAGFKGTIEEIMSDVKCFGAYGEMVNGRWTVLGEYRDTYYNLGY